MRPCTYSPLNWLATIMKLRFTPASRERGGLMFDMAVAMKESTIAREPLASEHMAQLHFFRLEVFRIVRVGFAPNRHLLDHLESIPFQPNHFLRVVGQEAELAHAQIEEDLRAETVIAQIARVTKLGVCFHGIESFLL